MSMAQARQAFVQPGDEYTPIPFWFWNDQPLRRMPMAKIPCGTVESPTFAVRYRGWFINDEVLLDPWKQDEAEHREVWRMLRDPCRRRCGRGCIRHRLVSGQVRYPPRRRHDRRTVHCGLQHRRQRRSRL